MRGESKRQGLRGVAAAAPGLAIAPHQSGVNPGDLWTVPTQPYPEAHFAVMPQELVRPPILATVPEGGLVADPFAGSGTVAVMARRLGRRSLLVDLNPDYCRLAARRFTQGVFGGLTVI